MNKTMEMYSPSTKGKVMAEIVHGRTIPSKGGSFRYILEGVHNGKKCLPKTVTESVFAKHGFTAETVGSPEPPAPEGVTGQDGPSNEPTNSNFSAEGVCPCGCGMAGCVCPPECEGECLGAESVGVCMCGVNCVCDCGCAESGVCNCGATCPCDCGCGVEISEADEPSPFGPSAEPEPSGPSGEPTNENFSAEQKKNECCERFIAWANGWGMTEEGKEKWNEWFVPKGALSRRYQGIAACPFCGLHFNTLVRGAESFSADFSQKSESTIGKAHKLLRRKEQKARDIGRKAARRAKKMMHGAESFSAEENGLGGWRDDCPACGDASLTVIGRIQCENCNHVVHPWSWNISPMYRNAESFSADEGQSSCDCGWSGSAGIIKQRFCPACNDEIGEIFVTYRGHPGRISEGLQAESTDFSQKSESFSAEGKCDMYCKGKNNRKEGSLACEPCAKKWGERMKKDKDFQRNYNPPEDYYKAESYNADSEESVVEYPDWIPDGDGRAFGQQNLGINLSPLHAESFGAECAVCGQYFRNSKDLYIHFTQEHSRMFGAESKCACGCSIGKCGCDEGCKCGCNHKKGGAKWAQAESTILESCGVCDDEFGAEELNGHGWCAACEGADFDKYRSENIFASESICSECGGDMLTGEICADCGEWRVEKWSAESTGISKNAKMALGLTAVGIGIAALNANGLMSWFDKLKELGERKWQN